MKRSLLFGVALMIFSIQSLAHEMWAEKEGSVYRLYYGHRGKDAKGLHISKIKKAVCVENGKPREAKVSKDNQGVFIEGPCEAIGVEYYWGYFSQTPDGEVNKPKDEVSNSIKSWESVAYLKCLYEYKSPAVLGHPLEILPLSAPQAGKKLEIQVLYNGAPSKDAFLSVDHRKVGNPDENGKARINLKKGLNVIGASLKVPGDGKRSDFKVLESYLCLEVP